jgi:S1-C subfamily serine protease
MTNDFRIYIERGLTVPGTIWGANPGARTHRAALGLEIEAVDKGGFAESAGLREGDLLLSLRGIRLHDTQQLWTVLALTEAGTSADLSWARGREAMSGKATF